MEKPKRIQRKRTKGWRMPENTVYVGRPTKWGNPYRPGDKLPSTGELLTPLRCYELFDIMIGFEVDVMELCGEVNPNRHKPRTMGAHFQSLATRLGELRGKNLACWCAMDKPCHADVLLELANR